MSDVRECIIVLRSADVERIVMSNTVHEHLHWHYPSEIESSHKGMVNVPKLNDHGSHSHVHAHSGRPRKETPAHQRSWHRNHLIIAESKVADVGRQE
jgi:hypothetical protein